MRTMRKHSLYLFILALLCTCDDKDNRTYQSKDPCDMLKDKVAACIGGRPVFINSECTEEKAILLLDMACTDLLNELSGK